VTTDAEDYPVYSQLSGRDGQAELTSVALEYQLQILPLNVFNTAKTQGDRYKCVKLSYG